MADWVLFDLNGTLVDPAVLAEPLGAGEAVVHAALDEAALLGAVAGAGTPFRALLGAALRRRHPAGAVDAALERLGSMPAYADARPALERLRAGGLRVGVLTQSAADAAEAVLAAASLRQAVDLVVSAPDSGAYKPAARAYAYGLEQAGASTAWFVAGHWWDIAGAAAAGLRTVWVSRTDRAFPDALPAPDVSAADLLGAADGILGG